MPEGKAAGDRDCAGALVRTRRNRLSEAGALDELQVHQIPALFSRGRWLFEVLPSRVELEIVRVIDTPEATHIRYRVRSMSQSMSGLLDAVGRVS
jgi:hypothetical protein